MTQVIDMHHHILNVPHYVESLIETMDRVGIDKVCLSGLGLPSDNWLGDLSPTNDDVLRAMDRYPDRIIGMGVIQLGKDQDDIVDRLVNQGFQALKTTRPKHSYDDPIYDPIYERAEQLRLPFLFHTGFIVPMKHDKSDDVSSNRMRPVNLDRVARSFPELPILIAHLGMPWHEEAAMMVRFHPNCYVDLTGSPKGWRNRKSPNFFQDLFYWEDAFQKVVFGTDVHWEDVQSCYDDHRRICTLNNVSQDIQDQIFGGTMARLLKIDQKG